MSSSPLLSYGRRQVQWWCSPCLSPCFFHRFVLIYELESIYNNRYNVNIYTNNLNGNDKIPDKNGRDSNKNGRVFNKNGRVSNNNGRISNNNDTGLNQVKLFSVLQIKKEAQIESLHLKKVNCNCNIRVQQQKHTPINATIK